MGVEAERLFRSLETDSVTSIRLNDKKDILDFPCDIDEVPWHEDGYYLSERPQFTLDPLFHAGCYYVQEASSMIIERILEQYVAKESIVLDLCAAPGGKATLISQYLGKEGLLIANEVVRQRVFILSENIQKWGNGNTIVTHNDAATFGEKTRNLFDCMLVDAPCSGEGMFRKDEEARSEWSLRTMQMCAERQRKILMDVWDALKPGGIMIYSTCTFNHEEDEGNAQWIAECLGGEILPLSYEEDWGIEEGEVGYHFYPHKVKGEGFYVCIIRKNEEVFAPYKIKEPKHKILPLEFESTMRSWLIEPDDWAIRQSDRFMTAYPMKYKALVDYLWDQLTCICTGFGIAEIRGKGASPQHALSMSKALKKDAFTNIELNLADALSYLRTEALPNHDWPFGTLLLTYQNVPIGFAKNVGNRLNNLYPNEWRIRKL